MQQCSKCKKWLEESEFYKNSNKKGSKNGLSRWCKECSKQCYQEHKEKNLQYAKQYRDTNKYKKEIKQYTKQYRSTHKKEIKQYRNTHKKENKQYREKHKEERKEYNKKYRRYNKNLMHTLKVNGCAICGYDKCDGALDFHHVNPKDKKFLINYTALSKKDNTEELNKCILLCANCHREIHYANSR